MLKQQGQQLFFQGKALYHQREPLAFAIGKLPEKPEEACLYIIPSPGLGHGVKELCQRLPSTSRILLLEANPELHQFSREQLQATVAAEPHLHFLGPLPSELGQGEAAPYQIKHALKLLINQWLSQEKFSFRRFRLLQLNRACNMQWEIYQFLETWTGAYIQSFWQNRLTTKRLGPLWMRNFWRNLAQLPSSVQVLETQRPIALVAAGSSLEWHLEWLKNERERLFISCVDTALLPLLRGGLEPDLVMSLDAQALNLEDFYGLGKSPQTKGAFLHSLDLSAAAQCSSYGAKLSMSATQFFPSSLWQRAASYGFIGQGPAKACPLEALGSVGISNVARSLALTQQPVFFIGYDFAFHPELHHCRGTSIHQKILARHSRLEPCSSSIPSFQRPRESSQQAAFREGFRSDPILYSYSLHLQEYLRAHAKQPYYRLEGPMKLPLIPQISQQEATQILAKASPSAQLIRLQAPNKQEEVAAWKQVRKFWQQEQGYLYGLMKKLRASAGQLTWQDAASPCDYLLALQLPKAGEKEGDFAPQSNLGGERWQEILLLARQNYEELGALIELYSSKQH